MKIFVWRFLPLSALKDAELLAPQTLSKPKGREIFPGWDAEKFFRTSYDSMKNHNFCLKFQVNLSNLSPTTLHFMCCCFLLLLSMKKNTPPRSPWVLPEKQASGPLPEHETQLLGRLLQGAIAWMVLFLLHPQKKHHFLWEKPSETSFEKAEKIHTQFWEKWVLVKEKRWNSILSKRVN